MSRKASQHSQHILKADGASREVEDHFGLHTHVGRGKKSETAASEDAPESQSLILRKGLTIEVAAASDISNHSILSSAFILLFSHLRVHNY